MKRSIVFVFLSHWGIASSIRPREFGRRMLDTGWEVTYLLGSHPDGDREYCETPEGARVVRVPSTRRGMSVSQVAAAVREIDPTHAWFLNPNVKASLIAGRLRGIRIIGDWEDWMPHVPFGPVKRSLIRWHDARFRRRADVVITASRWLQEQFAEMGRPDAAYVPYAPLPAVASDRPNPFDEPTAVFMGSLNSIWERDVLFDAATLLKAQGHRIPMTIIGGGRELPKWQAYIVEHGLEQVHLTGYLPDPEMISHLRHAHVLMFPIADTPANRARCPFKVFQYAQTGRPILTCRVGEVANLLEEKGVYAECDADDFAAKLRELMAQPDLPPIDYRLDRHTWDDRAARFIAAVEA